MRFWITEYGFPPEDPEEDFSREYLEQIQVALFAYAAEFVQSGKVERIYWYTLKDVRSMSVRAFTTGWEDILQYFYGDTREDGALRLLGKLLVENGAGGVINFAEKNQLMSLVDKASLTRKMPDDYKSQSAAKRR